MATANTSRPGSSLVAGHDGPRYVATENLFIERTRIASAGDEVPASVVEKFGFADAVEKVTEKDLDAGTAFVAPEAPKADATKGAWVAYVTDPRHGEKSLTEDEAKQLTRDQLADVIK